MPITLSSWSSDKCLTTSIRRLVAININYALRKLKHFADHLPLDARQGERSNDFFRYAFDICRRKVSVWIRNAENIQIQTLSRGQFCDLIWPTTSVEKYRWSPSVLAAHPGFKYSKRDSLFMNQMNSNKPQIGVVARYFPPSVGGVQTLIKQTADLFEERGFELKFFTDEQGESELDYKYTVIRYQRYMKIVDNPLLIYALYNFLRDCDIVHIHSASGQLSTITEIVAKLSETPIVLSAHGNGIVDHPEYNIMNKFFHNSTRKITLNLADEFISTCPHFTKIAIRYINKDIISEIPEGVDADFFTPGNTNKNIFNHLGKINEESNIILSVNMIKPVKGMQYMIQALPAILDSHPNTHYVVIGDGSYKSKLEIMADDLGISKYVHFPGSTMDKERIRSYLRAADVVVVPSSGESTSISALEALSTECPLVASPVGGLKELIGNNERGRIAEIFPPGSYQRSPDSTLPETKIDKLSNEISWVLSNPKEAKELGKEGRRYVVKNHSWPVIVDQISEIYRRII